MELVLNINNKNVIVNVPTDEMLLTTFRAPGHTITTLEGLEAEASLLADCLASEGADQCGFCTTGMMMSAIALKRRNPNASDDEIREYLIGNLCRCTGYDSQLRGVRKYLQGGL